MPTLTVTSPLGPLAIIETDGAITALEWGSAAADEPTPLLTRAADQLAAYFRDELEQFNLPFAPAGSAFQKAVWGAMQEIPFGAVRTYGDVAASLNAACAQAVGAACGANPIPILIPCHRIVAAGDKLGGYSGQGGPATKRFLLDLEGWPGVAQHDLFDHFSPETPSSKPTLAADG